MIERLADRGPLMLVLEDLHWADEMSLRLLAFVARRLHRWRVLVVATAREEELAEAPTASRTLEEVGRAGLAIRLALPPLSRLDTLRLVRNLAGSGSGVPGRGELEDTVWRVSEGNPLVAVEMTRALQQGAVVRESTALPLPQRVRDLVASRLERVSERGRQLAAVAAIIGREFEFTILQRASGLTEEITAEGVEELVRRRVLQGVGEGFDFTHDRVRAVVAGQLLAPRRKLLHRRVSEAIEAVHAGNLADHVERLAHHALQGDLWEKAVAYLRQAGLRAMARAANREATAHLEQALGALRQLPESRQTTELTIDIHVDLRHALLALGDRSRMGEHLHEAEVLARTLGDQRRLAWIATFMVRQCLITGDYDEAVRFGREALTMARTLGDRSVEILGTTFLGQTHVARGEFSAAATLLERNVALEADLRYEHFGTPTILSVASGAYVAGVLSQLGRFDEAIGQAEATVRIAEVADHPVSLYTSLFDLGLAHLRRGDLPRATDVLERDLDLCRMWQIAIGTPVVAAALGAAYALAGRADEALRLVAGAIEEFRRRELHNWPAFILQWAGMTCLWVGRIDEAASHAREALALTRRLGARAAEAHALCLAGDVASAGDAEDAEGYYREGLALADELGMRPV
ncbi:MAG: ATP-binding protein, partial [Solirubrobacterales bacterium]